MFTICVQSIRCKFKRVKWYVKPNDWLTISEVVVDNFIKGGGEK